MNCAFVILEHLDIPSDEQVLAFGAEPQFIERPPLLEWIGP